MEQTGVAGGLALWWSDEIKMVIHTQDKSIIDTTVDLKDGKGDIHITWIYGSTKWEEMMRLWGRLRRIADGRNDPWMCVGDYNEIASVAEKEGGRPKQQRMIDAFNGMIIDTNLVDVGFKGAPYTWTNNMEGDQRISERLDIALVNSTFIGKYLTLRVTHKLLLGSDHCPILIQLEPQTRWGRRWFRFEGAWMERTGCVDVVKEAWKPRQGQGGQPQIHNNLGRCRIKLT